MDSREILDALGTAVLVLDERMHVTEANAAARGLLGAGTLIGRSWRELLPVPALEALLERAAQDGGTCALREMSLPAGDEGRVLDVFVTALDSPPAPRALLIELTDAAQRRRMSRDAALLTQLDGSRLMARQLAHEIKNPLGGLRGAAQLLARQLGAGELQEYAQVIIREVDRLAGLVDSMLGPARAPNQIWTNLHELCEHVLQLLRGEADPALVLERDYDPSLPDLPLDRHMLVQALLNLGRNALQAAAARPEGGGRVVLRTRALHNQNIGARRHRLVCSVQFEDNGPGVPPQIRETLFYPLVTGRAGGSGLGLAVAQDLAVRHGGLIEYDSVPGRTRFTLLLPAPMVSSSHEHER